LAVVGAIADAFWGHGYCANNRWIVSRDESNVAQANWNGRVAPERAGPSGHYGPPGVGAEGLSRRL